MLARLKSDFPEFNFQPGDQFRWSPSDKTIYYDASAPDEASLLHELSHAVLQHSSYSKDIELIEMESQAWDYTKRQLASKYGLQLDEELVQSSLDTYRDWLHDRSSCPNCQSTGIESKKNHYACLACTHQWRVNEARICALRRYSL